MSKLNLTIKSTENLTAQDVVNAVRRAMNTKGLDLTPGTDAVVKGVKVRVSETAAPKVKPLTEAGKVRAWLNDNGHTVGARGRISAEHKAAYKAAHKRPRKPRTSAPATPSE